MCVILNWEIHLKTKDYNFKGNMNISNTKSATNMCLSKPKSALSTNSAIIRKSNSAYNNQRALYWNRRCQTAVYKPHRKTMEACSYHVVRQMELEGHKSALNNAVLVLGIHRSKSEVDVHSVHSEVSQTSSQHNIQREHSQIFLSSNVADVQRERRTAGLNREETKIPTTTVPKKGLIKLTALSYEVQDPFYYDRHKEEEDEEGWVRKKPLGHISDPHKPLVKKTMIEHMKEGNKMLAEEEKLHHEQEEIEKQLGEYTIGDLHKNLFDMTDLSKKKSEEIIKSVTTATVKNTTATAKKTPRKKPFPLSQRSVTLPSIKDFSFG